MSREHITTPQLISYAFLALPVAFAGFPLYILAPDFFATHYGVSLSLLGILLLAIRLLDAVQDPLIGWWIDRHRPSRVPLAGYAGAVLCLSVFGLFNIVYFTPAVWFSISMIAAVSAYSVLTIMLGASATLWTTDKFDQTRIAAAREIFGLLGLVIAVSAPSVLGRVAGPDTLYLWYAGILSLLMVLGVCFYARCNVHPNPARLAASVAAPWPYTTALKLPQQTRRLLAVYGLSMLASSIPAILVVFFVRDRLGAEDLLGAFLLLYFLAGVVAMPFWRTLSQRIGKYQAWVASNVLAVVTFIGALTVGAGDLWAYAAVCLASGLTLGADLILPPSLLADHTHTLGRRECAASDYSLLALIAKLSLALASAVALPLLDLAGFVPQAENSTRALIVLSATYALIPCLLKLAAAGLLYLFFIRSQPGDHHENHLSNLSARGTYHA